MAINFLNKIPLWENKGLEPSEELRESGFKGGYKPPAHIFNWFWHMVSSAIAELQSKISDVDDKTDSIGLVYDPEMQGIKIALTGGGSTPGGGGSSGGSSEYVLPVATTSRLGGVKIGKGLSVTNDGVISPNYSDLPTATSEEINALFEEGGD